MQKILVVDDESYITKIVAYKLRGAGFEVASARDGLEALEKVRADLPDLILLDVVMPRMDGFETLQVLKADPATRDIPVVFVTVKGKMEDRQRGLQLGAAEYLTKPFSPNDLLQCLQQVLHRGTIAAG